VVVADVVALHWRREELLDLNGFYEAMSLLGI